MFGKRPKPVEKSNGNAYQHGNEHLIELRQVVKNFQTAAGLFTALKDVDLRVDRSEFVAVIGKSGSGKSTLINMIAGIDRPTAGEVFVGDTAVHKLNEGQMAVWRGKNLGIVFQFFQLLPTLTLVENVMLPMDFCNVHPSREREKIAMNLLDQMEMADHAHKLPSAISGGQQQRVAIARALANDPPIIIADEPTGNLDSKTADAVFTVFQQLVDRGKTILMVTHDNDLAKRATRSVIIADGEIIEESLARVFASLSAPELIAATHKADPERYVPGAVIIAQGKHNDHLHVILKGRVEILKHAPDGTEMVVATMGKGQYFGEIEMLSGAPSIATVRASDDVETVMLDRAAFQRMVDGSKTTRAEIDRIAQQRLAENRGAR
ncbi:MAG: ATP-binding cassette domain-containing protein [Chloroflexi bacterium]|nr:ATP-binding cassette domain-containing protein [Chloroflexota bacterium]